MLFSIPTLCSQKAKEKKKKGAKTRGIEGEERGEKRERERERKRHTGRTFSFGPVSKLTGCAATSEAIERW
jgi:hypothetical protein